MAPNAPKHPACSHLAQIGIRQDCTKLSAPRDQPPPSQRTTEPPPPPTTNPQGITAQPRAPASSTFCKCRTDHAGFRSSSRPTSTSSKRLFSSPSTRPILCRKPVASKIKKEPQHGRRPVKPHSSRARYLGNPKSRTERRHTGRKSPVDSVDPVSSDRWIDPLVFGRAEIVVNHDGFGYRSIGTTCGELLGFKSAY
jgi:hypothetical protein